MQAAAVPSAEPSPSHRFLEVVDAGVRARITRLATPRRYRAGARIVWQDEPCAGLFVVTRGLVKVSKVSPAGREQVLRYVQPEDAFNETAALDGGPNAATALALTDVDVLVLSRRQMLELLEEVPGMAQTVIHALAGRYRHLVELVEDLSFRQVEGRVARVLLQAVAPHPGVGAGLDTQRRLSQREIAEMTGTSREVVGRALKALEASGTIVAERGEITVLDAARLRESCE